MSARKRASIVTHSAGLFAKACQSSTTSNLIEPTHSSLPFTRQPRQSHFFAALHLHYTSKVSHSPSSMSTSTTVPGQKSGQDTASSVRRYRALHIDVFLIFVAQLRSFNLRLPSTKTSLRKSTRRPRNAPRSGSCTRHISAFWPHTLPQSSGKVPHYLSKVNTTFQLARIPVSRRSK